MFSAWVCIEWLKKIQWHCCSYWIHMYWYSLKGSKSDSSIFAFRTVLYKLHSICSIHPRVCMVIVPIKWFSLRIILHQSIMVHQRVMLHQRIMLRQRIMLHQRIMEGINNWIMRRNITFICPCQELKINFITEQDSTYTRLEV